MHPVVFLPSCLKANELSNRQRREHSKKELNIPNVLSYTVKIEAKLGFFSGGDMLGFVTLNSETQNFKCTICIVGLIKIYFFYSRDGGN